MTIEEFCFNIVDVRTFHRYKTGERLLKHSKIKEFCDKLRISVNDFYYSASKQDIYEFKKINELYKLIQKRMFEEFYEKAQDMYMPSIVEEQNKRFFNYCYAKADYEMQNENESNIMMVLKKIANYPACLGQNVFDFVTLVSLQLIAEIEIKNDVDIALLKLIDILSNVEIMYTSSETNTILPCVYSNVAIFLLRRHRFDDCLKISKRGVEYSIEHFDMSGLAHLYYCKSISSLKLGLINDSEECAKLCLMTALVKNNSYELEMFKKALTKDFGFDALEFLRVER